MSNGGCAVYCDTFRKFVLFGFPASASASYLPRICFVFVSYLLRICSRSSSPPPPVLSPQSSVLIRPPYSPSFVCILFCSCLPFLSLAFSFAFVFPWFPSPSPPPFGCLWCLTFDEGGQKIHLRRRLCMLSLTRHDRCDSLAQICKQPFICCHCFARQSSRKMWPMICT